MINQTDTILKIYLEDINAYKRIDSDREKELADIIQGSEDPEEVRKAKDELVTANLRLVVKYALDYYNKIKAFSDTKASLMDLINEGNIGLMKAADLFKSEKGVNFSTYAYLVIQRNIKRYVKNEKTIRIPLNHFKHIAELKSLEGEYKLKNEHLTDDIIKKELKITDDMLCMIRKNREPILSIDSLEEEVGESFMASQDNSIEHADDATSRMQLREYLYDKMKELKPNYRDILFMRFFGNTEMTLEEIGKRQGLTRERIRQIIPQALKALRIKILEESAKSKNHNRNTMPIWSEIKDIDTKESINKNRNKERVNHDI